LRFGYPILIQDVEKIDPIMNSLLNKEVQKKGGRNLIRIGDKEIDFSMSFNMYMVTRDTSRQFTPDLCSRVTFLNFTITQASLQNQILSKILKNERPDVDKKKEDLVKAKREFTVQLRELEENLLAALNSEGNLLENDKVMGRLEEIKIKSAEISKEVSRTDEIMEELQITANEYSPVSSMASKVYFTLDSLHEIHYLYHFSLQSFIAILDYVITSDELGKISKSSYNERLEFIISELFTQVYHRVSYALLEKHKLVFALRLSQIRLGDKFKNEIGTLLSSSSAILGDEAEVPDSSMGGKLKLDQRRQIACITQSKTFEDWIKDIKGNEKDWANFIEDPKAEDCIPLDFLEKETKNLSPGDKSIFIEVCKSIVLSVIRPDRMMNTVKTSISKIFNDRFVDIPELDLMKVIEKETFAKMPIVFISAPGHDASGKIELIAKKINKKSMAIAIGSSEGFDLVEKNFVNKMKAGEWLILKNVHLAPSWLSEIEKKLYSNDPDPKFRLFLTMEFNPKVPANILKISRKFVFELPSGVKPALVRSYANVLNPQRSERIPAERTRLHFLLAWFHSVVGERLRYVPIGWSKFYEFNEADQKCALDAIDEWLDLFGKDKQNIDPVKIPWDAIRTILSESMYGGKIDNEYDLKILKSMVDQYFNVNTFNLNYPLFKSSKDLDSSNQLVVPECKKNEDFLKWIDNLPKVESPEWSGLPNNAEKLLREQASKGFLVDINRIQVIIKLFYISYIIYL